MTPVLSMKGVGKTYPTPSGPLEVLKEVDLEISPGSFVVITGPSGSGKSTLLHLGALLDTPTEGEIFLEGENVTQADERKLTNIRKDRIGMVFQKFCLLPHRTALENVLFRYRYHRDRPGDLFERANSLMQELGLERIANNPARLLSGGEMQRVAIARAMLHPPTILVSDEPTGNLDPASSQSVMQCFQKLNDQGLTILMVTHNLDLLKFATHRFHCDGGRIEEITHAS